MEREYEFFVTTEEPQQPNGPERGLIRRLVMRNFFETRGSEIASSSSKQSSASTVQAKTQLKTRFRLSKVSDEKSGRKAKGVGRKTGNDSEEIGRRDDRRRSSQRLSRQTSGLQSNGTDDNTNEPATVDEQVSGEYPKSGRRILLKIIPSAHRFDPFDVLPVPGSAELDLLFKLYKSTPSGNSISANANKTWWPLVSNDAGLLHATLATWALYGVLAHGVERCRVSKLRHKNEAIKEVNMKLGDLSGQSQISDQLVGTVLTLASFENLFGAYDAAQLHIAALKRMVNGRGGLFAFGHNDDLVRGMIWVDFHTSAAFHTSPSWPRIRLDPDTPPLPDELLEVAALTSPTSLLQLSLAAIECFNIFYRLHRVALALSTQWLGNVQRCTVCDLLYELMYMVLEVPDYSRDFLDFDMEKQKKVTVIQEYRSEAGREQDRGHDEHEAGYEARKADTASVVEALLAAVQVFVFSALRSVPPKAKLFSNLLERLRRALDRPSVDIINTWSREKNEKTLLWVLVVGYSVADAWYGRAWWAGKISEVLKELGHGDLAGEHDFKNLLKGVVWTDGWFETQVDKACNDAAEMSTEEVVLGPEERPMMIERWEDDPELDSTWFDTPMDLLLESS
ncbi:hypothetical protein K491DRAFT_721513 [Lophiostoma macrostomum CBS 122681]|uniref:Transcription factor domain-containing protein n=1 Tax=Lophiostoma macrostomum CBS 122681 TaxID=1314788 RepID=A0A6A6SST1_9PLEO|nr:hypothetical protein K491DRAFT_721513 [Lophiostoma macrostomum CBS 122681]